MGRTNAVEAREGCGVNADGSAHGGTLGNAMVKRAPEGKRV